MTSLPEPADDPGRVRASDADRERVARVLHQAMVDGRITAAELDERLGVVYAGKTLAELVPVTQDLPGHQGLVVPTALPATAPAVVGGPDKGAVIAVLSGSLRKGDWVVPNQLSVFTVMGGVELDLSHAQYAARDVTITVFALMGGVEIKVPPGVVVVSSGAGFMGAFEDRSRSGPVRPDAQIVRIKGLAMMSGVEISPVNPDQRALTKD